MRNALVIAAREFEEKRFVVYAAIAFAALPLLIIGVIPMSHGKSRSEAIVLLAVILSTGFTVGLGVITGASFIGRDLSDGRMSFYFSRPVGAASIWFGKLLASIVLIVGCFGIIATPARFIGTAWTGFWDITFTQLTVLVLTAAIGLFLIAHVIGTFVRSRSALIAADFAAAVLCGVAIWFLVLPLARGFAITLIKGMLTSLAVAVALAIAAGGAWQLERGRTDRRRNHLALSQFLWSTIAVALILAAGFVTWVVSAKPSDLTNRRSVSYAAGSPLLAMAGETRNRGDYNAGFLIDVSDGSTRRVDLRSSGSVYFTRDGASVVLSRIDSNSADIVVYKRGVAEPVETGLTIPMADRFFVSDDGNRIATIGRETLSIFDVAQKRSLISVRLPGDYEHGVHHGYFLTPDLVRLYVQARDGVAIYELDARTHELKATGSIAALSFVAFTLNPTGSQMLVRRHDLAGVSLNDARSGAVIKMVDGDKKNVRMARFLRDGRMAIVKHLGSKTTLQVLSPDGSPVRDIPFDVDSAEHVSYLGDDGTRVVLSTSRRGDGSPRSLVSINLDQGVVERIERGPFLWTMTGSYWEDRPTIQPLREAFYGDAAGHIVAWNPASGKKRIVAGG